jgi:hypothetical protein
MKDMQNYTITCYLSGGKMEVTEKDIADVITSMAKRFDDELFQKTEAELEQKWFFQWDGSASLEWNTYKFYDMLKLYGSFCRRWEEKHNGSCCVVERVRDKYLMPKIKKFVKQITSTSTGPETAPASDA